MNPIKASCLAIGTEILSGQIVNRNTAYLSSQLEELGIPTQIHLAVPDDRDLILHALRECQRQSRLVFVTGGLGPTTDDFTREVAAHYFSLPLRFHEASLHRIQKRCHDAGVPFQENQKQQCYYPEGAQVLENALGTANAFQLHHQGCDFWFLPGPPAELTEVWSRWIREDIRQRLNPKSHFKLFLWQCLGLGESTVGVKVEAALEGSGYQIGYRYHSPYVEVKVWVPLSQVDESHAYFSKLEASLGPWIIEKGKLATPKGLMQSLGRFSNIYWKDSDRSGVLPQRLMTLALESDPTLLYRLQPKHSDIDAVSNEDVLLDFEPHTTMNRLRLRLSSGQDQFETTLEIPAWLGKNQKRILHYMVEKALFYWSGCLENLKTHSKLPS